MPVYDTGGRSHASHSYSYGNSINYGLSNKEREEEEKKEQQRIERETRTTTLQIPSSKKPNASDEKLWKEFRRTIYRKYGKDVALSMPSSGAFFRLGEQINSTIPLKSAISIYKDWEHLWKMTVEEIEWRERVRPEFYHTQDYSEIEGEESAEPEHKLLTLEQVESQWERGELHLSAAAREFLSIKGEQFYQQGDYHNAYDFFLELFHREPDNHLALFGVGE